MVVALTLLIAASPGTAVGPIQVPLVVIDAGHGGEHDGAVGVCGLREKDVTLAISREVASLLEASGRARVHLTRTTDRDVDLEARAQIANERGADLFISVHANASTSPDSHGVETFFLSRGAANRRVHHLTHRENEGRALPTPSAGTELDQIIGQLTLSASHAESQRLAFFLQDHMSQSLQARGRGVLQAPFVVLVGAQMPAALVEVGFLTNPAECLALGMQSHRRRVARALAGAILTHLGRESQTLARAR